MTTEQLIESLLTGERISLSVDEQHKIATRLKLLDAVFTEAQKVSVSSVAISAQESVVESSAIEDMHKAVVAASEEQ